MRPGCWPSRLSWLRLASMRLLLSLQLLVFVVAPPLSSPCLPFEVAPPLSSPRLIFEVAPLLSSPRLLLEAAPPLSSHCLPFKPHLLLVGLPPSLPLYPEARGQSLVYQPLLSALHRLKRQGPFSVSGL